MRRRTGGLTRRGRARSEQIAHHAKDTFQARPTTLNAALGPASRARAGARSGAGSEGIPRSGISKRWADSRSDWTTTTPM
jgi:hypothetical protein